MEACWIETEVKRKRKIFERLSGATEYLRDRLMEGSRKLRWNTGAEVVKK